MKKLLVLALVLAFVSSASATIIDVVAVDIGQSGGRLGASDADELQASDIIGLKIVLNYNQNTLGAPPSYDGYLLSSMDLDLHVLGAGSIDTVEKQGQWSPNPGAPIVTANAGISPFVWKDSLGVAGGVDIALGFQELSGVALTDIQGPVDLVWDLLFHCDGDDDVVLDLTLHGLSQYKNDKIPGSNYLDMVEADLGDLVIHQVPEPMTLALLGLGGLFLRRRKVA
jgi:hypothetical protein